MKRILLISLALTTFFAAFGQYRGLPVRTSGSTMAKAITNTPPGSISQQEQAAVPPAAGFRDLEQEIGTTNFDIQTIASLGRRIGEPGNGTIGAAWQMAFVQPGFDDRGTGYNQFDGSSWGANPTDQVESSRSGYPSYTVTDDGTEVVISHKALTATSWELTAYTKALGEATWTEHVLPSDVPGGNVWAKIAAGGPDGNSLHVVAITLNPSFGGAVYQGMTNHPLYWRSTDGGQTWDKQDMVLPGVDSSKYLTMGAESYTIEAKGETVAIGIFSLDGDQVLVKSTDNGDTWGNTIISDFPLDKWPGGPYDGSVIPYDPNAPDSLWFLSTDGSGSMVIDENDVVHIFYSNLYVTANADTNYYNIELGTNGISYWNETSGIITTITGAEDWDGDLALTLGGDLGAYRYSNSGLASFPTATIDEDGNIYLVYMAFHELFVSVSESTYRHIFVIKSEDGGETWSAPFDIINEDVTEVPEFIEAAYPAIPPRTGDAIQLIYQQDYEPGLTSANTNVPDQYIMHVALDKNTFGVYSGTKEENTTSDSVTLSPNPAHGLVQVGFEIVQASEVQLSLFGLLGKQLLGKKLGRLPVGKHNTSLNLEELAAGVYFVKIDMDGNVVTKKLVVN